MTPVLLQGAVWGYEALCDSSNFTCFCTLCHYVTVNLDINENHVQYVHSKTDDPLWVTQCTV